MSTFEQRVTALEERMDEEANLRASQDRDLSDLAAGVRAQKGLMQALAETQSRQTAILERHTAKLSDIAVTQAQQFLTLRGHGDRLEGLEGKVEHLDGKVERLDGRVERLDTRVERLEGRVERLDGKVERLDGKVERLDAGMQQIIGMLDTLIERDGGR